MHPVSPVSAQVWGGGGRGRDGWQRDFWVVELWLSAQHSVCQAWAQLSLQRAQVAQSGNRSAEGSRDFPTAGPWQGWAGCSGVLVCGAGRVPIPVFRVEGLEPQCRVKHL